jgi:hypothetical protein
MDHRCPYCGADLAGRRLSQPIIARAEVDCTKCKRQLKVNLHPAEEALTFATLGGFLLFVLLGYWTKHQGFYAAAFAFALLGAGALPLAERLWLASWPRYVKPLPKPGSEGSDPGL